MAGMIEQDNWLKWMDELAENDFIIIDHFLSENVLSEVNLFFQDILEKDRLKKAAIGSLDDRKIIEEIRGDYTYWLKRDVDIQLESFFLLTEEMITLFNRYCFLSLGGSEFHLAQYPPGSFYKKHVDQFKNRNNRMITFILYLNEQWNPGEGGELVIYREKDIVKVEPIWNRVVMFKSEGLMHEVLPTKIYRRSLTGWFLYKPPIIGQLFG